MSMNQVTSVVCGAHTTAAITASAGGDGGTGVWTWGCGAHGALGLNDVADRYAASRVGDRVCVCVRERERMKDRGRGYRGLWFNLWLLVDSAVVFLSCLQKVYTCSHFWSVFVFSSVMLTQR